MSLNWNSAEFTANTLCLLLVVPFQYEAHNSCSIKWWLSTNFRHLG